MSEFRTAVINDLQIPYEDADAVDVAAQIIRDYKPEVLDLNGDILDLLNLSKFPGIKTKFNETVAVEFESELDRSVSLLKTFVKETKPGRIHWKNGNHEFRILRAVAGADRQAKAILELKAIRDAYAAPNLFRFSELSAPVKFAGEYPNGLWLHPDLPPDKNVWVEHGYSVAAKAGYTASALQEKRMSSVVIGHVHRASLAWKHVNGDRDFFMLENGGLSILGVPKDGDGMYFGSPYSVADYMNSTQGFSLITYADKRWWPELIRIHRGAAMWRGKLYKSRIKKGRKAA